MMPLRGALVQLKKVLKLIEENDTNYDVRTSLVYQAMGLSANLGFTVGIRYDATDKDGTDWPVVCIVLPNVGEVAWHCKAYEAPFSGYTVEQKYQRIQTFIKCN